MKRAALVIIFGPGLTLADSTRRSGAFSSQFGVQKGPGRDALVLVQACEHQKNRQKKYAIDEMKGSS